MFFSRARARRKCSQREGCVLNCYCDYRTHTRFRCTIGRINAGRAAQTRHQFIRSLFRENRTVHLRYRSLLVDKKTTVVLFLFLLFSLNVTEKSVGCVSAAGSVIIQ